MKDKLNKIINHYGVIPQLKYFQSEVFELNEAIIQREYPALARNKKPKELELYEKNHIAEEIADCYVMLEQFKFYYGIEDMEIAKIMREKINRQMERLKNE